MRFDGAVAGRRATARRPADAPRQIRQCPPQPERRRSGRRTASPSKPTTTTSSSTSTAMPCCRGNVVHAPGRPGHPRPIASNTTRRPAAPSSRARVEFTDPDAQGARQQRHLFPDARRAVRGRRVRAAGAQRARLGAQHAGGRATARSRSRTCPSPPARSTDVAWQLNAQQHRARHARAQRHRARHQRRVQGRAHHLPALDDLSRSAAAQERLPVPEHRRLLAQRRGDRAALLLEHPPEHRFHGASPSTTPSAAWTSPASSATSRTGSAARSSFNYLPERRHRATSTARVCSSSTSRSCRATGASASTPPTSSDSNYFEDFAHGPGGHERAVRRAPRRGHLSRRALERARAGPGFPDHRRRAADDDRPYARTPRLLASGDWDSGLGAIDYGFDAEVVNFDRNVGVTGWRMDVAPRVGFDWSAPGFFVRPSAGYRYTQYSLEDTAPGTDDSPTRSLPFASLDAGLVFERSAGSHGQRRMTLEPRALYLYTPFREQSDLPLFDTGLPDLNLVQLFRTNRYVGADRVNDANQIAFGLTSRLFDAGHRRAVPRGQLGQAYYFEKPRVVLPDETPSDARHLGLHRAGLADGLQELERRSRHPVESRGHAQRALAVPPAVPAGRRARREPGLSRAARSPRAGRGLRAPGRSASAGTPMAALSTACATARRSSNSPASNTRPAAGGMRAVARRFDLQSRRHAGDRASTCSWN